jgi:hypothetical protein
MEFILYKIHENKDCETLQNITRYLHYSKGIKIFPTAIIERHIPSEYILPTIIFDNGIKLNGLIEIVALFEEKYKETNLIIKATEFEKKYPSYRIRDISTHKIN